ncbi:MAG: two pore domain potassium channel family protein [Chloroflexi bacterium]|nr:two pore domain potassium channel family protein [Chloroflexota bacterium]
MLIEGWGAVDSLFMTVITLTTVGFGEVKPLSTAGRLFTMGLILLGVGTLAYGCARLAN